MDPVQFPKCISFFPLDRIIIYWNTLYDLHNLVGLPDWFYWTISFDFWPDEETALINNDHG